MLYKFEIYGTGNIIDSRIINTKNPGTLANNIFRKFSKEDNKIYHIYILNEEGYIWIYKMKNNNIKLSERTLINKTQAMSIFQGNYKIYQFI